MPIPSCGDFSEGHEPQSRKHGKDHWFIFYRQLISVQGVTAAQILQICSNYTQ